MENVFCDTGETSKKYVDPIIELAKKYDHRKFGTEIDFEGKKKMVQIITDGKESIKDASLVFKVNLKTVEYYVQCHKKDVNWISKQKDKECFLRDQKQNLNELIKSEIENNQVQMTLQGIK